MVNKRRRREKGDGEGNVEGREKRRKKGKERILSKYCRVNW